MIFGSKGTDGGNLMLEPGERDLLIAVAPAAEPFIKGILGSAEFINGQDRYCIWVDDDDWDVARAIPELEQRFIRTASMRLSSDKAATRKLADVPYRFAEVRYKAANSIIVPKVSSERREYIPIGYLDSTKVINNSAFGIYEADPWVLAILTSRMHMAWVNAVSGRMRSDYQYSNTIVYNNFPLPLLPDSMKEDLTLVALRVLDVREYHCERTLAQLYNSELMPADLREAHAKVDALVDSIYSKRTYETDEQRLSDLFSMYEVMTAGQSAAVQSTAVPSTLGAKQK